MSQHFLLIGFLWLILIGILRFYLLLLITPKLLLGMIIRSVNNAFEDPSVIDQVDEDEGRVDYQMMK